MTVVLSGSDLELGSVVEVARGGVPAALAPQALAAMAAGREVVEEALARRDEVYGLTTGVGAKKAAAVTAAEVAEHNRLLILNHRVGQGPPLPDDVVRAAALCLANGFASGAAGVRPELAEALVGALNGGVRAEVRRYGSIGMADLSANADLAHGLLGDLPLAGGEALALLSHNAVSTAQGALALADARALLDALDVAGALDLEAFDANLSVLDPALAESRPGGLAQTIERLSALLDGSALHGPGAARNLQDPLCFRCLPQVHGAARDALGYALERLAVELNAPQGNPLVVAGEQARIVPVGSFDPAALAAALDLVRIALAPVLASACERAVKLLQRPLSGLPEGLAGRAGSAEDGLAEFGIAAQALAVEARLLAQPVSSEPASTTQAEGIEDRATMALLGGRRLSEQVELGCRLVAIELVVAAQAVDLRGRGGLGAGAARAHAGVRALVPVLREGDPIPQDLEPVVELVRAGALG